jgi:hypothetical protein
MVGSYPWEYGGNLVLSVQEGLKLGISFDATGSVKRQSGVATIYGTVTCNQRANIGSVTGTLFQRAGRTTVMRGDFTAQYPNGQTSNPLCEPNNPFHWRVDVTGTGPFNSGPAEVRAGAYGCSQEQPDCVSMPQQANGIVHLKQTK